jgi:hypothetical protein
MLLWLSRYAFCVSSISSIEKTFEIIYLFSLELNKNETTDKFIKNKVIHLAQVSNHRLNKLI